MASDLALHLIPNRSLDQFLYLPVLVGVLVCFFFTEVYGWQFVGLVVPGYLAAVFCIQPQAGITIIAEGFATLALARVVSELLSRSGAWTTLFGRDRFFLIILLSVLVRQQTEIVWLPVLSDFLARHYGLDLHLERNYFSVALVLVPLVANSFWNLSFRRGSIQLISSITITFLVLRLVFLPTGILSLSRLELVYLDYELSFRALAKAYLLLLVGAALASRYNLKFGWDFNGIVVPALLALCWITPLRFVATLAEAVVLVWIVRGIESLPFLATTNLEGPRKMVLVYTSSVAIKLVAAKLLAEPFLGFGFADFFGFGHLLPSLIASKILDRKEIRTILLPIVWTSAVAFVVGSGIGVGLDAIVPAPKPAEVADAVPPTRTLTASPAGAAELAIARARPHRWDPAETRIVGDEVRRYVDLWQVIEDWLSQGGTDPSAEVVARARALGLKVERCARGARVAFVVAEAEERLGAQRGFDTVLLFPGAPGPILDVPYPSREPLAAEVSLDVCERVACRAITFGGDEDDGGARDARSSAHAEDRAASVVALREGGTAPAVAGGWPDPDSLWPGAKAALPSAIPAAERGESVVLAVPGAALAAQVARNADAAAPLSVRAVADGVQTDADYRALSESELRVLTRLGADVTVLPGLDAASRGPAARRANARARLFGMSVALGPDGAALFEPGPARRGFGALVVRGGDAADLAFEVPHPRKDAGAVTAAVDLWRGARARALLLGGGALQGEVGADPDPTRFEAARTPFEALHDAIAHALPAGPGVVVEVRALGSRHPLDADAVLGFGAPAAAQDTIPPTIAKLFDDGGPLAFARSRRRIADGSVGTVGLDGAGNPQLEMSRKLGLPKVAMLWLSEGALEAISSPEFREARDRFAAAGVPFISTSAADALLLPALGAAPEPPSATLSRRVTELAALARRPSDLARARSPDVRLQSGFALDVGAPFLVVEAREGAEVTRALVLDGGVGVARVEAGERGAGEQVEDALARGVGTIVLHGSAHAVAARTGAP